VSAASGRGDVCRGLTPRGLARAGALHFFSNPAPVSASCRGSGFYIMGNQKTKRSGRLGIGEALLRMRCFIIEKVNHSAPEGSHYFEAELLRRGTSAAASEPFITALLRKAHRAKKAVSGCRPDRDMQRSSSESSLHLLAANTGSGPCARIGKYAH